MAATGTAKHRSRSRSPARKSDASRKERRLGCGSCYKLSCPQCREIPVLVKAKAVVRGRTVRNVTATQDDAECEEAWPCQGHKGVKLFLETMDGLSVVEDLECDSVDIYHVMAHYMGEEGVDEHFTKYKRDVFIG